MLIFLWIILGGAAVFFGLIALLVTLALRTQEQMSRNEPRK